MSEQRFCGTCGKPNAQFRRGDKLFCGKDCYFTYMKRFPKWVPALPSRRQRVPDPSPISPHPSKRVQNQWD